MDSSHPEATRQTPLKAVLCKQQHTLEKSSSERGTLPADVAPTSMSTSQRHCGDAYMALRGKKRLLKELQQRHKCLGAGEKLLLDKGTKRRMRSAAARPRSKCLFPPAWIVRDAPMHLLRLRLKCSGRRWTKMINHTKSHQAIYIKR